MRGFPLHYEDLKKTLDDLYMEARCDMATHLSRAIDVVLENYRALELSLWNKSTTTPPQRHRLVLVAYRYRTDRGWRFEIARPDYDSAAPEFWVKNDGEYVHELRDTWWQELHGPFVAAEPKTEPPGVGTETPGVVTERGGVATEPPGVGTEAGGVGR